MRNLEEVVKLNTNVNFDTSRLIYFDTGGLISRHLVDETHDHYGINILHLIPAITMAMNSTLNNAHWYNTIESYIDQLEEAVYLNDSMDTMDFPEDRINPTDVIYELCSSDFLDRVNHFSKQVGRWLQINYSNCQSLFHCEVLEDIEFKNENILSIPCVIEDYKEFSLGCQATIPNLPSPPSY